MNKTKFKIIRKAIELFNEFGYSNISLTRIANELSVSPGNLTYHFKKKDDLMNAVYAHFQSEVLEITEPGTGNLTIREFDLQLEKFYSFQIAFKFFYLDLLEIQRAFKDIAKAHQEHISIQINRVKIMLQSFNNSGVLKEGDTGGTYELLAHHIWLTTVYWMSQSIIRGKSPALKDMKTSVWSLLKPHMTQSGRQSLKHLSQNQQAHCVDPSNFT